MSNLSLGTTWTAPVFSTQSNRERYIYEEDFENPSFGTTQGLTNWVYTESAPTVVSSLGGVLALPGGTNEANWQTSCPILTPADGVTNFLEMRLKVATIPSASDTFRAGVQTYDISPYASAPDDQVYFQFSDTLACAAVCRFGTGGDATTFTMPVYVVGTWYTFGIKIVGIRSGGRAEFYRDGVKYGTLTTIPDAGAMLHAAIFASASNTGVMHIDWIRAWTNTV